MNAWNIKINNDAKVDTFLVLMLKLINPVRILELRKMIKPINLESTISENAKALFKSLSIVDKRSKSKFSIVKYGNFCVFFAFKR